MNIDQRLEEYIKNVCKNDSFVRWIELPLEDLITLGKFFNSRKKVTLETTFEFISFTEWNVADSYGHFHIRATEKKEWSVIYH